MLTRVLLALAFVCSVARVASAQPVTISWRPPTGCSASQAIVWNGTAWTCGTVSSFSTLNAIPKGDGSGMVASSWTDDGTTSTTTGAVTIAGSLTSGDAAGDVFDHNGQLAKFGSASDGYTYIHENTLNFHFAADSEQGGWINYRGYNAGNTQFRNLIIGDGKQAAACTVTGSTKTLNCVGGLQVNGTSVATTANVSGTAGRSARFTGANTVANGSMTDNGAGSVALTGSATTTRLTVANTAAGGREYFIDANATAGGAPSALSVWDNTAGAYRFILGSTGNVGIGPDTTPDFLLDVQGTLGVDGNTQLGDASTDRVGIGIAPDSNHAMTFAAAVGNKIALYPVDATSGYGFGVQNNQLQYYVPGGVAFHSFGSGDSDAFTESQRLDADGQVWFGDTANTAVENNLDVFTIGNTGTGQTASNTLIDLTHSGTFDTSAAPLAADGVEIVVSASRSAGANTLTSRALRLSASGGQIVRALQTDDGDVLLNNTSGTFDTNASLSKFGNTRDGGVYVTGATVASLNFEYASNAEADGWVSRLGYNNSTTQFRNTVIGDGKAGEVARFTGSDKAADFYGPVGLGDAETDTVNSLATLGFSGANPSIASGSATVSGESQSFQVTLSAELPSTSTVVVNFGRTFTAAPYCVMTGANANSVPLTVYVTASTTQATITADSTTPNSSAFNLACFDRF